MVSAIDNNAAHLFVKQSKREPTSVVRTAEIILIAFVHKWQE